jgi:hypothetical protein
VFPVGRRRPVFGKDRPCLTHPVTRGSECPSNGGDTITLSGLRRQPSAAGGASYPGVTGQCDGAPGSGQVEDRLKIVDCWEAAADLLAFYVKCTDPADRSK